MRATPDDDLVIRLARERGWLRDEQIAAARAAAAAPADPALRVPQLLELLVAAGVLTPRQIARLLADEFGLAAVELDAVDVPDEVLRLVPRALAVRHGLLPLARDGRTLRVAIGDPLDTDGIDDLGRLLGLAIEPVVAPAEEVARAIGRFYGGDESAPESEPDDVSVDAIAASPAAVPDEETSSADDAPVVQLVHALILEAIRRRASDIHLEPLEKRFRVRYRIDGVLLEVDGPPKRLQAAVVSRLKIMANLSIAEKRLPQDGRIQIVLDGKPLDLRVSSLPTAHGESVVMRILDRENLRPGLPELGFLRDDQAVLERLLALPDGIVLVTGPTGSGKTTTLYSCLHHLNRSDRKIITVEDPVEYQLTGVNQVPVRHDVGMTFASALRAMLRQAPNVVMIGEIRDRETAEIAIHAALTGHLVFSTLHTNDAPGAVTRLIDLGVKPFLVATTLRAALAQRLVRKVCPACRRPQAPSAAERRALGLAPTPAPDAAFLRGSGCPECSGTGYRGRLGIFELLVVDEEIQGLIHENAGSAQLRARARARGLRTMREDGVRKAIAGLTTIEEVVSITVGDAS